MVITFSQIESYITPAILSIYEGFCHESLAGTPLTTIKVDKDGILYFTGFKWVVTDISPDRYRTPCLPNILYRPHAKTNASLNNEDVLNNL